MLKKCLIFFSNFPPNVVDKEDEDYCEKDVYRLSVGVLIISYVVMAVYALIFLYRECKRRREIKREEDDYKSKAAVAQKS